MTQELVKATATAQPYPIKAWIVYGQNIFESIPQKPNTRKAIEQLDLMVVVDVLPGEQADYADIVLPSTTFLEHTDLYFAYGHYYLQMARPAVAPPGAARSRM